MEYVAFFFYIIDARNAHIVYPQPEDCRDYIRNKIVIDADSFESFCKDIGIYDSLKKIFEAGPVSTRYNQSVDLCYKKACELFESKKGDKFGFLHGYIVELLHFVYENLDDNISYSDEIIQKILMFISDKNGKTSLEEISRQIHMSKFYLSHMFKAKTGRNISDYISDKIYENSLKMLKVSTCSIEEIALQCGFSSASAFTRFFKNKSGVSPSQFRKKGFS